MVLKKYIIKIFLKLRRVKYSLLSNNKNVNGKFIKHQPVVINGEGNIEVGENVNIGVFNAPFFYNGYAYIEARKNKSKIKFGNNIHINNNFSIVSEKSICIDDEVLIGFNCSIIDSNFHDLDFKNRKQTDPNPKEIIIKKNVFIGNNVTILKGVIIGENTVIANGAVVTKSFPANVIVGGIPAKIIKKLD